MVYLLNAFSLNMLSGNHVGDTFTADCVRCMPDVVEHAAISGGLVNAIGHPDTDRVARLSLFAQRLAENGKTTADIDMAVVDRLIQPGKRMTVALSRGDVCFVAQYTGPRLPEGAVELPEGAEIVWWRVEVK